MTIRFTPIFALTMALGLAACQEEENTAVTETTETTGEEESGIAPGDTTDAGSVTVIEPEEENASVGADAEESSEVEAVSTEMEETNEEAVDEPMGGGQAGEPAATPAEDAAIGAEGEGAAVVEPDEGAAEIEADEAD